MTPAVLALTFHFAASRRITQIGLVLGVLGGLLVAAGSVRRSSLVLGGLLVAAAFVLVGISVHWGTVPYRHH